MVLENLPRWRDVLAKTLGGNGELVREIVHTINARGGRALAVGGWVRDLLRGEAPTELDVEVYGVEPAVLKELLGDYGEVETIGEAFGILKIHGLDVDFAVPRRENKLGLGHKGFEIFSDPLLNLTEAARRRDLTINSIGLDLTSGELIDAFHGVDDLVAGVLRATAPEHFVEDPLRVYRVAQLAARLEYTPSPDLVELCSRMSPEGLPPERIVAELDKLLLAGVRPSLGLAFLRDCGWIRYHPELEALVGCEQDEEWHPEGDVWTHTLLAVDAGVRERSGCRHEDRLVMYGTLCHDLGKATTTELVDGRIRSRGHCQAGEAATERFLGRLTRSEGFIRGVIKIIANHMVPQALFCSKAGSSAFRRLARRLAPEANIKLLVKVARADYRGSGRGSHAADRFPAGDWLLEKAERLAVEDAAEPPVLMGRHLIDAGLDPGPHFSKLLNKAYEIQTDEGIHDIAELLARIGPSDSVP